MRKLKLPRTHQTGGNAPSPKFSTESEVRRVLRSGVKVQRAKQRGNLVVKRFARPPNVVRRSRGWYGPSGCRRDTMLRESHAKDVAAMYRRTSAWDSEPVEAVAGD